MALWPVLALLGATGGAPDGHHRAERAAPLLVQQYASKADRVRRIVADHVNVAPGKVRNDSRLIDDLGADSLALVEIMMALENEFDIDVGDYDNFYCTVGPKRLTVGVLVVLVERQTLR